MTEPLEGRIPTSPEGPGAAAGDRRTTGLLVAAGIVAVLTVVLVVTIGVARPPALEAVDDASRPDAALVLFGWRDEGNCLEVIEPDGTVREVRCGMQEYGQLLVWDERGIGLVRFTPGGEQIVLLDPVTGLVASRSALDDVDRRGMGSFPTVSTERSGGELVVRDPDGRVVWRVASPETYRINGSAVQIATGRLALLDSAGRLLVLEPGAAQPRVWVEDIGIAYGELLWEGTDLRSE
jgi:hypothetical protein